MTERVVIGGALAQRPHHGGHTWVFLQYLLGFKALGWDVVFLDRLDREIWVASGGRPSTIDESVNLRYLEQVMRRFGLDGAWAVLQDHGKEPIGLSRRELMRLVRESTFLLNVNGFVSEQEILDTAPLRVFLDIDPGFGQMWKQLGLHDLYRGHDVYVTVGENVGGADCAVPTCGLDWITTPQPIVLERWPAQQPGGQSFTSIGSWRGPFDPVEYRGTTYGLRVHEFRKFSEVPKRSRQSFEIALEIDDADGKDVELLRANGWVLVDPRAVSGDPPTYQRYIQSSKAEFMVAKNMYVRTRSGWFSDRSACYLASGKPVLAQDTGFSRFYPTGEGLLTFASLDEALAGVEQICAEYPRHARAARILAQEHFDSGKVLGRLLTRLGLASAGE